MPAFGPITCVFGFADLGEANSLPVAFQSSTVTRALAVAREVAERLDASAVMVNDHTDFRTDSIPFGGMRQSGDGIGGIPYTARELTSEKMTSRESYGMDS